VFAVRVSPGGPTAASDAPPASDNAPATPNTVTAFVRPFRFEFRLPRGMAEVLAFHPRLNVQLYNNDGRNAALAADPTAAPFGSKRQDTFPALFLPARRPGDPPRFIARKCVGFTHAADPTAVGRLVPHEIIGDARCAAPVPRRSTTLGVADHPITPQGNREGRQVSRDFFRFVRGAPQKRVVATQKKVAQCNAGSMQSLARFYKHGWSRTVQRCNAYQHFRRS
jgi:hypothetical protein